MKHTPGPWKWQPAGTEPLKLNGETRYDYDELHGENGDAWVLLGVLHNDSTAGIDVSEANARLIASAPQLLEALEEINKAMVPTTLGTNELSMIWRRARDAIKQAKGDSA